MYLLCKILCKALWTSSDGELGRALYKNQIVHYLNGLGGGVQPGGVHAPHAQQLQHARQPRQRRLRRLQQLVTWHGQHGGDGLLRVEALEARGDEASDAFENAPAETVV